MSEEKFIRTKCIYKIYTNGYDYSIFLPYLDYIYKETVGRTQFNPMQNVTFKIIISCKKSLAKSVLNFIASQTTFRKTSH